MEAENLWRCFLETGAPEYYLLYKAAKAEGIHQLEATNMPKSGAGTCRMSSGPAKIPGFCEFKTIKSGGNPCT